MEQQQIDEEIDEADRQFIAQFAHRLQKGDTLAQIFGVADDELRALESQAYRLYRNGQFDRAKVACRGILALDEQRVVTRVILGDIALEEHRFKQSVEHLEAAIEVEPEHLVARSRLGEALLKRGDASQARLHLKAVVDAGDRAGTNNLKRCQVLLNGIDE